MTIKIPAADYLYMTRFAGNGKDGSTQLVGVYVEAMRLVATNGHVMGVLRIDTGCDKPFLLATDKNLMRACKGDRNSQVWLICYPDRVDVIDSGTIAPDDPQEITVLPPLASFPAAIAYVDVPFLNWRSVVPSGVADGNRGDVGTNAFNMALFAAAGDSHHQVSFEWDSNGVFLVANSDPRFIGVLMGIRTGVNKADIAARREAVMGGEKS